MPPKPKFTREEIVAAALDIVRERGLKGLTARDLGARLGASARPIFTVFENMEDLTREVMPRRRREWALTLIGRANTPPNPSEWECRWRYSRARNRSCFSCF